jgi:hypothetical protein
MCIYMELPPCCKTLWLPFKNIYVLRVFSEHSWNFRSNKRQLDELFNIMWYIMSVYTLWDNSRNNLDVFIRICLWWDFGVRILIEKLNYLPECCSYYSNFPSNLKIHADWLPLIPNSAIEGSFPLKTKLDFSWWLILGFSLFCSSFPYFMLCWG